MTRALGAMLLLVTIFSPFLAYAQAEQASTGVAVDPSQFLQHGTAKRVDFSAADISVTPAGAFSMTKLLQFPPGRNGVEPTLSIAHNSQADDGLMGPGTTLAGLPLIIRIPGDRGIVYDNNDIFAIAPALGSPPDADSRLVRTAVNFYQQVSSSRASFTPVFGTGCGTNQPCYWIRRDGFGNTYYFGGDETENVDTTPGLTAVIWERPTWSRSARGIFAWLLKKIVDANGNSWVVSYTSQRYPDRIEYTLPAAPLRHKIQFEYVARNGKSRAPYFLDKLLSAVESFSEIAPGWFETASRYEFAYETSPASRRKRLTQILEKAGGQVALQPTVLTWNNGGGATGTTPPVLFQPSAVSAASTPHDLSIEWEAHVGDVNGDGFDDAVFIERYTTRTNNRLVYALGGPSGLGAATTVTYQEPPHFGTGNFAFLLDLNGDGKRDVVFVYEVANTIGVNLSWTVEVMLGTATGLAPLTRFLDMGSAESDMSGFVLPADVNGDQIDDLLFVSEPKITFILGTTNVGDRNAIYSLVTGQLPAGIPAKLDRLFAVDLTATVDPTSYQRAAARPDGTDTLHSHGRTFAPGCRLMANFSCVFCTVGRCSRRMFLKTSTSPSRSSRRRGYLACRAT